VGEKELEKNQEKKITKNIKIIAVALFFIIIGLVNFLIMYYANFLLIYLGILGALSLTAAVGLLTLKRWGFYLALIIAILQFVVGSLTLYSSLSTTGSLNPSLTTLTLNLGLVGWVAAPVIAAVYLTIKRSEFH
jgi:hypothetical protein